jgi:hypothetical protein
MGRHCFWEWGQEIGDARKCTYTSRAELRQLLCWPFGTKLSDARLLWIIVPEKRRKQRRVKAYGNLTSASSVLLFVGRAATSGFLQLTRVQVCENLTCAPVPVGVANLWAKT